MKPCATCKYRGQNLFWALVDPDLQKCRRPNRDIDPVTGRPEVLYVSTERAFEELCGPEGRYHSDNEAK